MELFSQHSLLAWTHVYPAQPEVEEQWLQQSSALLVIIAVLCKFVPSLFLPTMVSHMPGDGDGEGEGEGSAQVGGAGPNFDSLWSMHKDIGNCKLCSIRFTRTA